MTFYVKSAQVRMPRAVAGSVQQCFHFMMHFLIVSMTTRYSFVQIHGNGECEVRISASLRFYKRVCSMRSRSPRYVHTTQSSSTASWARSSVATSVQRYSHCKKIRANCRCVWNRAEAFGFEDWEVEWEGEDDGLEAFTESPPTTVRTLKKFSAVTVVANSGGQGASRGRHHKRGLYWDRVGGVVVTCSTLCCLCFSLFLCDP